MTAALSLQSREAMATAYLTFFQPWHLRALDLQPSQAHTRQWVTDDFLTAIEGAGAWTLMRNGKPLAVAGVVSVGKWPRYAWAFLGSDIGTAMTSATRRAEIMLGRETEPVFAHVNAEIEANVRWLTMLGFEPTGDTDALPDGNTYELWKREPDGGPNG